MLIPQSQFYVFVVEDGAILCQTFEEALNKACEIAKSTEFVDLTPNEYFEVVLAFPKTRKKITIQRKLFTYNKELPLATPNVSYDQKTYDYRNIGV